MRDLFSHVFVVELPQLVSTLSWSAEPCCSTKVSGGEGQNPPMGLADRLFWMPLRIVCL
jgi:hypothetical protein